MTGIESVSFKHVIFIDCVELYRNTYYILLRSTEVMSVQCKYALVLFSTEPPVVQVHPRPPLATMLHVPHDNLISLGLPFGHCHVSVNSAAMNH